MSANNLNLYRNANEGRAIGNKNPPNMASIPDSLLTAASPVSFSLLNNTKIKKEPSDIAVASCRSYKDMDGLRQLGKEQVNKTYHDPRCGWRYKPSTGLYPEISQGALGTANGPTFGQAGSPDEVSNGTQWFWNLEDAEKKISSNICQNAKDCKQLALLGRYSNLCGYCKATGAIIPVVGNTAKYPNDSVFGCLKKDIITASSAPCPATESFTNFRSGNLKEAFNVREGFGNLDDLNNCMDTPLTRDCVIKAAQNAGCSPDGALIQSLYSSTGPKYDSKLTNNAAYRTYNQTIHFTNGLLDDGSVTSIGVALDDFGRLMGNTNSQDKKLSLAARDLCIKAGEFDNYDFCMEMKLDSIINSTNISCAQKMWGMYGGTKQGTRMPTLDTWNGRKYIDFLISEIPTLINLNSDNKNLNSKAIKDFIGTDSSSQSTRPGIDLPMNENTRGAETVWFDLGDISKNSEPVVILKCDLRLKKDTSAIAGPAGEVLPFIGSWVDMMNRFNFTNQNNKAYTSAFEIRIPPQNDNRVMFHITTDDGFMLSKNQNPFEKAGKGLDWGSWRYQGPSTYQSPWYTIDKEQPNIFVTKWFQGYGEATSQFWIYNTQTSWKRGADSTDLYLTQEPLAPWAQYEICSRPNDGAGTSVGFFEKRWNGPSAMNHSGTATPSFDVTSKSIVYQTDPKLRATIPGQKGYASFISNSYWHTNAYFHFNAFRTMTILIRPTANLTNGGIASVFHHCNFNGYSAGMYLKNNGGRYTLAYGTSQSQFQGEHDVAMNEWNLIVIQYIGDEYGIRKITCNVERLSDIQQDSGRNSLLQKLSSGRSSGGSIVIGNPRAESLSNAGMLIMGAINANIYPNCKPSVPSFTGDVAWVHGFRNYLDTTETLNNEIIQGWISRWAIPNLPNDIANPYSYKGCWKDTENRALPHNLGNVNSVAECANLSKTAKLNTFGLQYYGQCWAGNNTNWDRYGSLNDQGCGTLGSDWNNQVYTHREV
jgi:hypothetical protein